LRSLRGDEKLRQLAKLARRLPRPGIIYCSTTKMVEDVWLGLRLIKVPCARYHGKMTDKERTEHQARFMKKGKRIVMVATSAFGLGIDKPDIRYIIHYQAPASLERYLQRPGAPGVTATARAVSSSSTRATSRSRSISSRSRASRPRSRALRARAGRLGG